MSAMTLKAVLLFYLGQYDRRERYMTQSITEFSLGEDLYAVSVAELESRLGVLEDEITRIKRELSKKQSERSAADNIFARKS